MAFAQRGESIADWAIRHNFRPQMVYAVLAGRNKGLRGEGHRIAVALDLKPTSGPSTATDEPPSP
nr:DNA-binding protein [Pseudoduganella danionis]